MVTLPFHLQVFTPGYVSKGPLGAVKSLSGSALWNDVGSAEFEVPADHPRVPDLNVPGARVTIDYRPDGGTTVRLASGRVEQVAGGGGKLPWRRYALVDDFSVLTDEVVCWPKPGAAITAQSDAYHTVTGPAETVLKSILAPNVSRDGVVLTIPASAGLGPTVTGSVRFHTPAERLLPLLTNAGLGVRVRQSGSSRVLDVWEPATYPRVLTEGSGVVVSGEYSVQPPTVTRVVVGAGGEGAARVFRSYVDSARESAWSVRLPTFRDARDIEANDPDLESLLQARADETLAEGAPVASVRCELVESAGFRFGQAFQLGDVVSVQLSGGAPVVTDRVREVTYSWTKDAGAVVTPRVGEWQDVADAAVVGRVQALTRAVENLQRS